MDRRLGSQPTTARRGVPSEVGATSAWISTSSGRVPSMPANTAVPGAAGVALGEEQRGRVGDLGAGPRPVISNTPISSVGPKRFFTARRMRNWCAAVALEGEHRVDHVLDHARAGDLAVLGDVADQDHGGAACVLA